MAGITKQAIRKAVTAGKLTSQKDEHGHVLVQAADVERVWPPQTGTSNQLPLDTTRLQAEVAAKDAEIRLLRERITEIADDREHWRQQAERITGLLTDDRPSWWRRWINTR